MSPLTGGLVGPINAAMKTTKLALICLLVAGCQSGSLFGQGDGEAPSGVDEHEADPAGEAAAPVELPEGSSSEADIKAALMGGVPAGRWKEGLLYEGIRPQPWLKSASNWFPRTEDVQPREMRIIFMGTAPFIRPGQMNTSIFVQLGNGENFVFDIGEGSVANYIAAGFALNELDKVFITHLHVDRCVDLSRADYGRRAHEDDAHLVRLDFFRSREPVGRTHHPG